VCEGVVDEGYSGEIIVKLYNNSDRPVTFERGDKIAQLLIMPVLYADFEQVEEICGGERGSAGFGSTGK
jgi:dUTP pyrophosphatase